MTRALRRARAALVRQVAQQKGDLLVFNLSQPWTKRPGIFVRTPTVPSFTYEEIEEVVKRILAPRVTITLSGVAPTWTTTIFPEYPT